MDFLINFMNSLQHIDQHLYFFIRHYGIWTYLFLFLIIFCNTGFAIMTFLPGDSILLMAGAFSAHGRLDIRILVLILTFGAILGNMVNYWIGNFLGPKIFHNEKSRFFKRENLLRAHDFYGKYGGLTVSVSCFIPFIRSFAPLIAGIANMNFGKFMIYNVLGAVLWIVSFELLGFFFGKIPLFGENIVLILFILLILFIIIVPIALKLYKARKLKTVVKR